ELRQPRVHVAAQRPYLQPGPPRPDLRGPAQARRAHDGAVGKRREVGMAIRYEGVARILARQDGREPEGPRQHHRDILERMHREVRPALEQRMLELLDEQRLAADL